MNFNQWKKENPQWKPFHESLLKARWRAIDSGFEKWYLSPDGVKFYPFNHNPATGLENWRTFADVGTTPKTGGEL